MGFAYVSELRRMDVLAGLVEQLKATRYAEVGCKEGRTVGALVTAFPELHAVAVDPWAPVANADEDYEHWNFKHIEEEFWQNVKGCEERVTMVKSLSLPVAADYARNGEQFDLVFIDAAHDEENATDDIRAWWPLVRKGGFLAGHDYQHKFPGVMRAVAKSFPLLKVAICPDSVWIVGK